MMEPNVTESINEKSLKIDEMSSLEIISLMNEEDKETIKAVNQAIPTIAEAVDAIVERWQRGGRCFVVGAGTSGRLAIIDAVELVPTFSINEDRWVGLIAGGHEAIWASLEENEDDEKAIVETLKTYHVSELDVVIGITASGSTPFVLAATMYAKEQKALTVSIACNKDARVSQISDIDIELLTGAEVIRGSTRLKAGTAQKMVLNMISTATMVRLGKVYKNEMIDMKLINKKLVKRAVEMVMQVTGITESEAISALRESKNDVKSAIFLVLTNGTNEEAKECIRQADGSLKKAIQQFNQQKN